MDSHASKHELDPGDDQDTEDDVLTEQDLTFLLHYISPSYLTPDMIGDFSSFFETTSSLQLEQFFNAKFATELKEYITAAEMYEGNYSESNAHPSKWKIALPPQKHRFAYLQGSEALHKDTTPISRILTDLLHSHAFKKWLALVSGLNTKSLIRQNAIARRFRRGKDYALANPFQGEQPQLEFTISMTPSEGWEPKEDDAKENTDARPENGASSSNGVHEIEATTGDKGKGKARDPEKVQVVEPTEIEFGGEEAYMAGDEDDDDNASIHSKSLPSVGKKADPAVYKSTYGADDEDDGILFANPPSWNRFSIVLRDKGTLRFVKYVSQAAKGDRWDIKGEVELGEDAFGEDGGEDEDEDEVEEEVEGEQEGEDGNDDDDEDEELGDADA